MTSPRDLADDMGPTLDHGTAERLLQGLHPDDAPPEFAEVAAMLAAVAGVEPADAGRGRATVYAMAASIHAQTPDPPVIDRRSDVKDVKVRSRFFRAKLVTVVAAASLVGSGGLAMAGGLPGGAQGIASDMLARLGIAAPDENEHEGDDQDTQGTEPASSQDENEDSSSDDGTSSGDETSSDEGGSGKGSLISGIAHTTTATGVDKGAEICTIASEGRCQAGQHGHAGEHGDAGEHGRAASSQ
jgi:hypothetical protein